MAPSLRKRLAKRPPPDIIANETDNSCLPLLGALEHLPKSKEELSSTPPPPEHLLSPQNSQKARRSPSKSLLDRYKVRAPGMKAASSPVPGEQATKSPGKTTSFTEDFQDDETPLLKKDAEEEAAEPSPIKSNIRTVAGVDFQMVNSRQPAAAVQPCASADAEPLVTAPAKSDTQPLRRSTRSQTRREQRADSAVSESSEISSIGSKSKDAATETIKPNNDAPRIRSILKKRDPVPATPAAKPKIPRTIRPVPTSPKEPTPARTHTPPLETDSDSTSSTSNDSNSIHSLLATTAARVGDKTKRHLRVDIPPVKVLPPLPNDDLLPGLLWASPLSANSRPDTPWTWCKRWTCCRCEGRTIVEQAVCSRLACGHQRCGSRCRILHGDKKLFRI